MTSVALKRIAVAYTLEGFGLGIDPVQRRLIPAILYGATALSATRDQRVTA